MISPLELERKRELERERERELVPEGLVKVARQFIAGSVEELSRRDL